MYFPRCWYFDNGATSKIDDVLTEHGVLLLVLPLAVHLKYIFCWTSIGDHSKMFLLFGFCCGTPPSCLKVRGGGLRQHFSPNPFWFQISYYFLDFSSDIFNSTSAKAAWRTCRTPPRGSCCPRGRPNANRRMFW